MIVTAFTPSETSGRGLRTVGIARALARLDDVEIAYVEFDGSAVAPALVADPRVTLRPLRSSRGLRRLLAYVRARRRGTPIGFARGVSPELLAASDPSKRVNRVLADGPIAAAALVLVKKDRDVVYIAHNLESISRVGLSSAARDYGDRDSLRDFERDLMNAAAETWLPSERDTRDAASIAERARVRFVPSVVDVRMISPVAPSGERRILFVADFAYEPNRLAARLLLDEIMPAVWQRVPSARVSLVGRSFDVQLPDDPRIEVRGFVDDLHSAYASADCVAVPVVQGGGSQLKFIEALAYGLPVVATPFAASGLGAAEPGVHFEQAGDAASFADALARLLEPGDPELGRRGRVLAENMYSIEALAEILRSPGEGSR